MGPCQLSSLEVQFSTHLKLQHSCRPFNTPCTTKETSLCRNTFSWPPNVSRFTLNIEKHIYDEWNSHSISSWPVTGPILVLIQGDVSSLKKIILSRGQGILDPTPRWKYDDFDYQIRFHGRILASHSNCFIPSLNLKYLAILGVGRYLLVVFRI